VVHGIGDADWLDIEDPTPGERWRGYCMRLFFGRGFYWVERGRKGESLLYYYDKRSRRKLRLTCFVRGAGRVTRHNRILG
jgi:hypothetical protein